MFLSPPKFLCWNPDAQHYRIKEVGPWEVLRSREQSPQGSAYCSYKRVSESWFVSFPMGGHSEKALTFRIRKRIFTRNQPCWYLDLDAKPSEMRETNFCC